MRGMVQTYSQNANRNMRRPIIKEDVLQFLRTKQTQNHGHLAELEAFAKSENIPIIQHEVVAYFRVLLKALAPAKILEIGTAIGFSALVMADVLPEAKIVTIDRNDEMIALAQKNLARFDQRKQITLLQGDAADILKEVEQDFDFVFMDSAKSKYVVFLPEILRHLKVGGVIVIDDVFQGGDIVKPIEEVHRSQRAIYRGLQKLFEVTLDHPALTSSLIPLSDGLLMIRKDQEVEHL